MSTSSLEAGDILRHAADLYQEGRLDESEELFEQLATGPDPAEGHHGLGIIALRRNDAPAAVGHFVDALRHAPQHAGSLYWLAGLGEAYGAHFEAGLLYRATLASDPAHEHAAAGAERLAGALPAAFWLTPDGAAPPATPPPPTPAFPEPPPLPTAPASPSRGRGVRGTVVDLTPVQHQAWNTGRFKQGFNFRLQTPDGALVEVEIRGQKVYGRLRNGDDVEVLSGYDRRGLVTATRLYNHSSRAHITRRII